MFVCSYVIIFITIQSIKYILFLPVSLVKDRYSIVHTIRLQSLMDDSSNYSDPKSAAGGHMIALMHLSDIRCRCFQSNLTPGNRLVYLRPFFELYSPKNEFIGGAMWSL